MGHLEWLILRCAFHVVAGQEKKYMQWMIATVPVSSKTTMENPHGYRWLSQVFQQKPPLVGG